MKYFIYGLYHPITDEPFYVGVSSRPARRYMEHIYGSYNSKMKTITGRRDKYIYDIIKSGNLPVLKIIKGVQGRTMLHWESYYVYLFLAQGHKLIQSKYHFVPAGRYKTKKPDKKTIAIAPERPMYIIADYGDGAHNVTFKKKTA